MGDRRARERMRARADRPLRTVRQADDRLAPRRHGDRERKVAPGKKLARKVKAKTVSVALSKEQFEAMRAAISNWKELKAKLVRMEELSRLIIFGTTPDTRRDKRLTKATLGLGKRPKTA